MDFTAAVSEYNRMLTAQVAALLNGEGIQFEREVDAARTLKDLAKQAIVEHMREHGC